MKDLLIAATEYAIIVIDSMALVIIVIGTIEAFIGGLKTMLGSHATEHQKREVWLRYARWLVAGLTFQLAADIIETSIAPTWQDVARLGAIAVIRTFLNYFLEKDLVDVRERDRERREDLTGRV